MHCFLFLCWVKVCSGHFRQVPFSCRGQKKLWLVMLDRWSSYTGMTVWELAQLDSILVVLDKWSSYRGGCLTVLIWENVTWAGLFYAS